MSGWFVGWLVRYFFCFDRSIEEVIDQGSSWIQSRSHLLEEGDDLLLPEDALVLLAQVDKGVGGLAVPDVGEAGLDAEREVVADDLDAPASFEFCFGSGR